MLDRINRPALKRDFLTYDLEWSKGAWETDGRGRYQRPKLTLCGVFDGKKYRAYRSINEFLDAELTRKNHGKWFYAHAGGLADSLFLLQRLVERPEYEVSASFSGSSAIIIRITRGPMKWVFVDSYWLLRDRLANIAKFVGMEKGEIDFETDNLADLLEYNRLDCEILWHAVAQFEGHLLSLGGELAMTLASSAMQLFRRVYLKSPIRTRAGINEKTRGAYYASRVEVIRKKCEGAFYYDVNSSFPHAMTFPVPGNLIGSGRTLHDRDLGDAAERLTFADVTVSVPHCDFPPLPFRYGGSVYFPVGCWRAWLSGIDIELLLERGGRVVECHETLHFEPRTDLRDYALDLYERRLEAKRDGRTMEVVVYKLLLNSLYGKFGESREKTGLVLNPSDPPAPWEEQSRGMQLLFPGAWIHTQEVDVEHEHVPIAAWITSIARRTLYRAMVDAWPCFYCDTDGFATTKPDMPTGDELGELKLETVIANGTFHRPKVYMLEDAEGRKRVKAKGFSLKADYAETLGMTKEERDAYNGKHSVRTFLSLLEGEPSQMRRFMRVRELFKSGKVIPTERIIEKRFRDAVREKRKTLSDGVNTVPWHVQEIESGLS